MTIVGPPQASAREAAQVLIRADQDDAPSHLARLHRRHHRWRVASIDNQVRALGSGLFLERLFLSTKRKEQEEAEREQAASHSKRGKAIWNEGATPRLRLGVAGIYPKKEGPSSPRS